MERARGFLEQLGFVLLSVSALLIAAGVLDVLIFHSRPMRVYGVILSILAAVAFGVAFLAWGAATPRGSERNRSMAVGAIGLLPATATWLRDLQHVGPRGNWLWLILLVLFAPLIPLFWDDLRRGR